MGIFQLVEMIEDKYGVEIDDEELVLENFATLETIGNLVSSKLEA